MKLKTKFVLGLIFVIYAIVGWILEIIVISTGIFHPVFLIFGLAGWIKVILLLLGIYLIMKTKPLYWRCLFVKQKHS